MAISLFLFFFMDFTEHELMLLKCVRGSMQSQSRSHSTSSTRCPELLYTSNIPGNTIILYFSSQALIILPCLSTQILSSPNMCFLAKYIDYVEPLTVRFAETYRKVKVAKAYLAIVDSKSDVIYIEIRRA